MPRRAATAGQADLPEEAKSVRLEDVLTFLKIYRKANKPDLKVRTNFSTLLTDDPASKKGLTTRISQLGRVVDFLYGEGESQRTGLHRLFERDHLGGLVPSADAHELYKHFEVLVDVYGNMKDRIAAKRRDNPPPLLRVGSSQTIGIRLLAAILSHRHLLFPDGVQLEVEIADSHDLISRLKARLLDVVIAYGSPAARTETVDPETELAFRSLGYGSRMVLLCSPTDPLWVQAGAGGGRVDANKGYWQKKYHGKKRPQLPPYDELRPIDLRMIDFAQTRLIVVDSWDQPRGLDQFLDHDAPRLPPHRVLHVTRYEQALALSRMGQGVAVATEVFSRRARIAAFRLTPEEDFVRWIGAYFYPPQDRLPGHVRRLIRIVERYLKDFEREIRLGEPPAYDDERYAKFCDDFLKEPDDEDHGDEL